MKVMLRFAVITLLLSSSVVFAEEPNRTEGRYQLFESHFIVQSVYSTLKIDSQTGKTWILKNIDDKRQGWIPLDNYMWTNADENQVADTNPDDKKEK